MDAIKAADLEARLLGTSVDSFVIEKLIGFGKSAAVFRAASVKRTVAVKIFDDELIERYGDETQFARIERERSLIGASHPNLVKILAGGVDPTTSNHYVIMDFHDGPNLKEALPTIPASSVGSLIAQLARAARFLEDQGFCHRDIKPENIVLTQDLSRLVLLDLGVIRPMAGSDLTDADGIHMFIGTLQYSSPEFLLRAEDGSPECWRALTYYQIGAVLHDLIMRRPLFDEFTQPYARLVNAVQHDTPQIQNSAVSFQLLDLARSCLIKDWKIRLRLVSWDRFEEPGHALNFESAKQRVTNRGALAQARAQEQGKLPTRDLLTETRLKREVLDFLSASARSFRSDNPLMPPLRVRQNTPTDSSFTIEFPAAPEFNLATVVSIVAHVGVADGPARVVLVQLCGCTGRITGKDVEQDALKVIYHGVYDTAALERAFEDGVYDLIDVAQRSLGASDPDASTWLQKSDAGA